MRNCLDRNAECRFPFAVNYFQLPEATAKKTESRIARISGGVRKSILGTQQILKQVRERTIRHLGGDVQDFRDVAVDLSEVGPLARRVLEAARQIPIGQTVTYAELATTLDQPSLARAVGSALGRSPVPLVVPCHPVTVAHGKPGGFSAYGGRATKAKLLALEGATVNLCLELE